MLSGSVFLLGSIIFVLGFAIPSWAQTELDRRLKAGEVIAYSENVEGTKLKRGTVVGLIDGLPETVWQVITDNNHFKDFMPHTLESKIVRPEKIKEILEKGPKKSEEVEKLLDKNPQDPSHYRLKGNKYVIYFYSLLDFPWPISNKWYIIRIERDERQATKHIYKECWDLEIGNLEANQGYWLLEPYEHGTTKVTYQLFTNPGGAIPKFFLDMGTKITMPNIIRAVRERATQMNQKK